MNDADPKALEIARAAAEALQQGADPEAFFGTLLPVLIAAAVEMLGADEVLAQLEHVQAEIRQEQH